MILNLPLAKSKDEIEKRLKEQKHLLLTAPTGTGKSSFLPWLLAGENKRVIVLQPRQLAARELAKFLSTFYKEDIVGYKFRFEQKINKNTRILFQTYGSFLAEISSKASASFSSDTPPFGHLSKRGEDWIIFDEFHERKADMDLLLGWALAKGQRVAVLSAELEREVLENYLGVKCLKIENPGFPVKIMYQNDIEIAVKNILFNNIGGTTLVFLPGKAEIKNCMEKFSYLKDVELYSLYGGQLKNEQNKIFEKSDKTRIIFTTNIAETSLTIPNVKAVIDSGFERMAFEENGFKTLRLQRISMQNAVQRTGRAGRVQNGLCIRIWTELEEKTFATSIKPEIERINLERFLLQKYALGNDIKLLTSLNAQKEKEATEKLQKLGAFDFPNLLKIPVQSIELAVALAKQKNITKTILAICMILESENKTGNILHLAEDFLENRGKWTRDDKLHFEQLLRYSPFSILYYQLENIYKFLLSAFPDLIAYKNEISYKTSEGTSIFCDCSEEAILVLGLMKAGKKITANLYAPIPAQYLKTEEFKLELQWKSNQFVAVKINNVKKIECSTEERKTLENQTAAAWKALMEKEDFTSRWQTDSNLTLLAKMKLAAKLFPEHNFPKFDEEDFELIMEEFCTGIFLLRDLSEERYKKILEDYFGSYWLEWLHKNFPSSLKLSNGKFAKYLYNQDGTVEISARIGDFIGMQGEHFIAENRLKVLYNILAPNYRTAQKTWNLTDFWQNTYPQIKKELKGRYPKHPWI